MWSSLWRLINRHRLLVIMASGLFVFFGSGATTFYWANYPGGETTSMVKQRQSTPNQQNPDEQAVAEDEDTIPLSIDNWESFLDYEGPRERMLGIKQNYESVNFRRGPGIGYPRIVTPSGGTLLQSLDRLGDWYRARLPDGRIGWIHRSLVRQLDVPAPIVEQLQSNHPPLEESTEQLIPEGFWDHNRVRITEPVVNVRQGPGTQFSRIGRSYQHEELRLFAKQGNWYRIQTVNNEYGWIHESLAESVLKDDVQPSSVSLPSPRIRTAPDYQLREQSSEQNSVNAEVIDKTEEWYQVRVDNGNIGWVPKSSVSNTSP